MNWNILKILEGYIGRGRAQETTTTETEVVDKLGNALGRLRELTHKLEQEQETAAERRAQELKDERLKKEIERAHSQMLQAILTCHKDLGTGLDESRLKELHDLYEEIPQPEEHGRPTSLQNMIKYATAKLFHEELGPPSWQKLLTALAAKGIEWPDPEGLSPNATAEEKEKARAHYQARNESAFLERPLRHSGDLIIGVVKIWRASYPTPSSGLYRETVYEAVASAFRAESLERALKLASDVPEELVKKIDSLLTEELGVVYRALNKDDLTLDEAHQANQVTSKAYCCIIPRMLWNHVKSQALA